MRPLILSTDIFYTPLTVSFVLKLTNKCNFKWLLIVFSNIVGSESFLEYKFLLRIVWNIYYVKDCLVITGLTLGVDLVIFFLCYWWQTGRRIAFYWSTWINKYIYYYYLSTLLYYLMVSNNTIFVPLHPRVKHWWPVTQVFFKLTSGTSLSQLWNLYTIHYCRL